MDRKLIIAGLAIAGIGSVLLFGFNYRKVAPVASKEGGTELYRNQNGYEFLRPSNWEGGYNRAGGIYSADTARQVTFIYHPIKSDGGKPWEYPGYIMLIFYVDSSLYEHLDREYLTKDCVEAIEKFSIASGQSVELTRFDCQSGLVQFEANMRLSSGEFLTVSGAKRVNQTTTLDEIIEILKTLKLF